MNDYIEILSENGEESTYEVITTFRLDGYSNNYVIYSELDHSAYYIAKYSGLTVSDLDTNISEEEMRLAKDIFDEAVGNRANAE